MTKRKIICLSLIIFILAFFGANFIYPRFFNEFVNTFNNTTALQINEFQTNNFNRIIIDFTKVPQIQREFSLGLDLAGGALLIYEADLTEILPANYGSAMSGLRDVIERRINIFGVREPRVMISQVGESHRLIVELAGVTDIREAIRMIGETPFLEFKKERPEEERNAIIQEQELERQKENPDPIILLVDPNFQSTDLTGKYLENASAGFNPTTNLPIVNLQFDEEGTRIFADLTRENINRPLAIYLDGFPISIPIVQEEITGGQAQISGEFTLPEVRRLVERLNQGALPVPIRLISQQTVSAFLGEEFLEKAVFAGIVSLAIIILFMLIVYKLYGLAGGLALIIYLIFSLVIFKALPITLTLAGIVGFILSLGMAVDANVLIFEHAQESFKKNKQKSVAINDGFQAAWPAIRDANITTIFSAIILFYFTTGMIQGFALTLGLGIILSMISAVLITRLFLKLFIK